MKVLQVMLALGLLFPLNARAFDPFSIVLGEVQEGNQFYQDQHFDQALEKYESAEQQVSKEPKIHFNRGDALFKLGRAKEAREAFLRATGTDDPELKKKNYYNIGNTFLSEGAFPDAISYYRRALELDPRFDDARFNLELALKAIQQQKQQQNDQKQDKQDKDKRDKDKQDKDKQDKDKQDKDKQDKDKQDKDKQDQDKQDQDKQDQDKQDQDKQDPDKQDQDKQDKDKQDQGKQDQDKQDQDKQDKDKQDQGKQDQDKQDQDKQEQDKQDQKQEQRNPKDAQGQKSRPEPGRLSPAQVRDLLDAMRENEKPFQMDRFMMPKYKRRQVEKDW